MFRKAITAILARSAVWAVLAVWAISALAQVHSSWGQQTGLTNPGFEEPRVEEGTFVLVDVLVETMPGWKTTDTHFEIWGTGFKGVPAHEGTQFVELNAFIDGTLYQDSTGIQQGSVLEFTFAHRGRNGDDTMKLTITDLGADNSLGGGDDTVLFTNQYTTGKDAWAVYDSTTEPKIKAIGNTVQFAYGAISTATGELGEGNLLDAANFGIGVVSMQQASVGIMVGSWEIHQAGPPVAFDTSDNAGMVSALDKATIPTQDDPEWKRTTDATVNVHENSAITNKDKTTVDYTFFQVMVTVPEGAEINTFQVKFDQVDDAARIWLFNSKHPKGKYFPDADVLAGGQNVTVAADFKDEVAEGENRIVITQYDNYPVLNTIKGIHILVDGREVKPGTLPTNSTTTNSIGMEFNLIPAGTFMMGSPDSEEGRDDDEQQYEVTITRDYYMGITEVTQSQWQQVMGTTPWKGQENVEEGKDNPATCISWNDAAEFCRKLSQQEGRTYRLPTEAEWEYACCAGTTTTYSFGDDASQLEQYAWYFDSEPTHPSQVKQKRPNGFGLYDMHGNVWEFCQDWYGSYPQGSATDPTGPSNGTHRVMRGGSYGTKAPMVRSAHRNYPADLAKSENVFGLRVVKVPGSDSGPLALNETPPENAMQRDVDLVGNSATNKLGMEFKLIPAGTFMMGSPDSEEGRGDDEQQRDVTITRDYYIGVTEVTQSQWQQVMGTTPWKGQEQVIEGNDIAASYISWNDAVEFCRKLSQQEGRTYRLPTEAEWEYACRAGTTTAYSFGDDVSQLEQYAWYFDSEPNHSSQVKQKSPNRFGLYDMHGNLIEFCQDWYGVYPQGSVTDPPGLSSGTNRVCRGGCFLFEAPLVRSASRRFILDSAKPFAIFGLRVVLVPESDSGQLALNRAKDLLRGHWIPNLDETSMRSGELQASEREVLSILSVEFTSRSVSLLVQDEPVSLSINTELVTPNEVYDLKQTEAGDTFQLVLKDEEGVEHLDGVQFLSETQILVTLGKGGRPIVLDWSRGVAEDTSGVVEDTSRATVVAWGNNEKGQTNVPDGLSDIIAIAAGGEHSMALKADGTVVAWGNNGAKQTDIPAGLSGVIAIAAGGDHSLALRQDGTVVAWGFNFFGQTSVPEGLSGVTAIAAGNRFSMALKADGTVVAWGEIENYLLTPPEGLSGVTAIDAGNAHSLALKQDGTVVAWGTCTYGSYKRNVPEGLSGVTAIAAAWSHHDVALKQDGTIVGWASPDSSNDPPDVFGEPKFPAGMSGVIAIAAGEKCDLALKQDGTVVAWGSNEHGVADIPEGLSDVTAIAAGRKHALALLRNGKAQ